MSIKILAIGAAGRQGDRQSLLSAALVGGDRPMQPSDKLSDIICAAGATTRLSKSVCNSLPSLAIATASLTLIDCCGAEQSLRK